MTICYANQHLPEQFTSSIFLAGCTPREGDSLSWREEALDMLQTLGYKGCVFVPVPPSGTDFPKNYKKQIEWETQALEQSDIILFWIPRNLKDMHGLTTNVEFGSHMNTGKVVLGYPKNAERMRYLKWWADKYNIPTFNKLIDTVSGALDRVEYHQRVGAECKIPANIWVKDEFRSWYYLHVMKSKNKLADAKLLWSFYPNNGRFLFCYAIWVKVWIEPEQRYKENEFIFGRPDISSVMLYRTKKDIMDSEILFVEEFRSPIRSEYGKVVELPGGSTPKDGMSYYDLAAEELHEETGIQFDPTRFEYHCSRQIAATLSIHKSYLLSYEIKDDDQWNVIRKKEGEINGNEQDSERCEITFMTFRDALSNEKLDWSMIGMIAQVLHVFHTKAS